MIIINRRKWSQSQYLAKKLKKVRFKFRCVKVHFMNAKLFEMNEFFYVCVFFFFLFLLYWPWCILLHRCCKRVFKMSLVHIRFPMREPIMGKRWRVNANRRDIGWTERDKERGNALNCAYFCCTFYINLFFSIIFISWCVCVCVWRMHWPNAHKTHRFARMHINKHSRIQMPPCERERERKRERERVRIHRTRNIGRCYAVHCVRSSQLAHINRNFRWWRRRQRRFNERTCVCVFVYVERAKAYHNHSIYVVYKLYNLFYFIAYFVCS